MIRNFFCLLAVALIPVSYANAADQKKGAEKDQHHMQATVTSVNAEKRTITVKHMDKQGKPEEKTLQIGDDTKLLDANGSMAKLKSFNSGDDICVTKQNDKVTELRKHAEAKITRVDAKAGTVTVQMTDKDGKSVEKTFQLVENSAYVDSQGNVAVIDVFKSGDEILYVEADGKIKTMKQSDKKSKSSAKSDNDKNDQDKNAADKKTKSTDKTNSK